MSWDRSLWGRLAGSNIYCAGTDPADLCPKLSPKNKGVPPYIPLQAGYRSKKQNSTQIWLHMALLPISFPQCYVTFFMFQFFKFYLSALPSSPPVFSSEHQPVCFFSGLPFLATVWPYYLFENINLCLFEVLFSTHWGPWLGTITKDGHFMQFSLNTIWNDS
jgi:hypothetical protein